MKALFFDLDGTLTDISRREIETLIETLKHFGVDVSKANVKKIYAEMPSYVEVLEKLGLKLADEVFRYLTSSFVKKYRLAVARKGVKSTLKTLSEKYVLACVTSRETFSEVIHELNFLGIDHLFSFVVARDIAAKHFGLDYLPFSPFYDQRKRLYQCALELARCSAQEAVVIGDMERELKPAKELGITTIGIIAHQARKNELEETSDFLISDITQLLNVLPTIG